MSHALRAAVSTGEFSNDEKAQLLAALDSHEKVEALRSAVGAFDWKGLLKLLPVITQFIPGLGPIISAVLAILDVLPLNGGGDPPTPIP